MTFGGDVHDPDELPPVLLLRGAGQLDEHGKRGSYGRGRIDSSRRGARESCVWSIRPTWHNPYSTAIWLSYFHADVLPSNA
jgi:hypothetical protein